MTRPKLNAPAPAEVFVLLAWALPPVAIFASRATVIMLLVGAALLLLDHRVRREAVLVARSPLGLACAGLIGWAAVTALWAPESGRSLLVTGKLICLFGAGLVLVSGALLVARNGAAQVYVAVSWAGVVTLALLAFEAVSEAQINTFLRELFEELRTYQLNLLNRASAITMLVVWLTAVAMSRRAAPWNHPVAIAALLVLGLAVFSSLPMAVVPVAFVAGAALGIAVWLSPRIWLAVVAAAVAVTTLAAPLLPLYPLDPAALGDRLASLPASLQHRLHIWSFVAERIQERPLRGWGLDASRWFQAGHITIEDASVQLLPLHPHNGVLQVWLELGLPGALILAAVAALLVLGLSRHSASRLALASGVAVLVSFGVLIAVSFGVWQSWWLATAWLVAAFTVVLAGERSAGKRAVPE